MEYDIELAGFCGYDEGYLRLYRWDPYCISIGAHQSFDDIDKQSVNRDKLDVVKRPTGGRAILHAEELTYSVVLPVDSGYTPKSVYYKVSVALLNGLSKYSKLLKNVTLQSEQPDFRNILKQPQGKLCFASTAKSEITYSGKKLVGSAQRKMGSTLLQHGSILCGSFHKNIIKYLTDKSTIGTNLDKNTCDIESITGEPVDYEYLAQCVKSGFEDEWEIKFNNITKIAVPHINSQIVNL
jgi:lipoate-protein ligase A